MSMERNLFKKAGKIDSQKGWFNNKNCLAKKTVKMLTVDLLQTPERLKFLGKKAKQKAPLIKGFHLNPQEYIFTLKPFK